MGRLPDFPRRLMEILLLTVAGSLLLAGFFIVGFVGERSGDSAPNPERDSLLPLDDEDQFTDPKNSS